MNLNLSRASRNARTLKWLGDQPVETLDNIRMLFAGNMGCPLDETTPLDEPQDDEALSFVYSLFCRQIDAL